jgi:purine-nucleoside/S-methyl-5'-thioadenosine phosphorylase / adenosine deaminase
MMLPTPNDHFRWTATEYGPALVCAPLEPFAAHLFTTRPWPLGSAAHGDARPWDDVARVMEVGRAKLVRLHQVHGATVVFRRVGELRDVNHLPDADIVASNDPSLALAIQTADCVPLLIADRRTGVVAAAHAGWRGLAAGVPREAVEALGHRFDSAPSDLVVAIGPSISAARYEVGRDVREKFEESGFSREQIDRWFADGARPDHWQFDGWQSARDQLEAAGVPHDQIFVAGLCTASHPDLLCSYRRDWKDAGRMAAVIRATSLARTPSSNPPR